MAVGYLANDDTSYIKFLFNILGGLLEYARFAVNVEPTTLVVGLAPVATSVDANGMVATSGDITYPITPADVGLVDVDGGETWTQQTTAETNKYEGVVGSASTGTFIAVSQNGTNRVFRSTDNSQTWSAIGSLPTTGFFFDVTLHNNRFVASIVNTDPKIIYSDDDGLTWTACATSPSGWVYEIASDGTTIVSVGNNLQRFSRSLDGGENWIDASTAITTDIFKQVCAGTVAGSFLASGTADIWRSLDSGDTWTALAKPSINTSTMFEKVNDRLIASYSLELFSSTDNGDTWTLLTQPTVDRGWASASYENGLYVIVGSNYALTSSDGVTWAEHLISVLFSGHRVGNNGAVFSALATSGTNACYSSPVGSTAAFTATDQVYTDHNKPDGTISATLNGGTIYNDIHTGVTEDLQPVFFSDGANTDITIDKTATSNQTFFESTSPGLEHRYTFAASDSADTGTAAAASGVDTGTITYDGSTAVPADASSYITMTTTMTPKVAHIAFEKTVDSASAKQLIGFQNNYMSLTVDNNQLTLEKTSAVSPTVVLDYVPNGKHLVSVRRTTSSIDVIFNGLRVYTSPTNTPASSTGYRLFRKFDNSNQSDMKLLSVEVEQTLEPTDDQLLNKFTDFVKSGLLAQDYTVWNGNSRVVTVKTTGGDLTTTQESVDALMEGNETIVIYDGISPTPAVGLPVNAQVIDLAVSAAPTTHNWVPFA